MRFQLASNEQATPAKGTPLARRLLRISLTALCTVFSLGMTFAVPENAEAEGEYSGHRYVGVRKCGSCHKKELLGNQRAAWRSAPHAKAFETLKNEESKAIAQRMDLKTPPEQAPECLRCHVTAFGLPESAFAYEVKAEDGVQCESCHGPGKDYRKKKVMADPDEAHKKGLWDSDDPAICTHCHNPESPTFDPKRYVLPDGSTSGFDFDLARKRIPHPIPKDTKGRYLEIEKQLKAEGKKVR